MRTPGPTVVGPGVSDLLRDHKGAPGSVLTQDIGNPCLKT
jgi:hypothetical protein